MTALTDAEKQARARARKAQAGLVLLREYVPAERLDEIRAMVRKMVAKGPQKLAEWPGIKQYFLNGELVAAEENQGLSQQAVERFATLPRCRRNHHALAD